MFKNISTIAVFLMFVVPVTSQHHVNDLIAKGLTLHDNGKYKQAIDVFDKVLNEDENNPDVYYYRGNAKFELLNFTGAIEDYSNAI